MNNIYASIDLDNAGQLIGAATLSDDLEALKEARDKINAANNAVKEWVKFHQGEIINIGGDEAIFSIPEQAIDQIEDLKARVEKAAGTTVTIGLGQKPSEASKSLYAGKVNGKDQIVEYSDEVEQFLHDAHAHAMSGEGSEDEEKIEDHYLSHMPEYQSEDESQGENEEYQPESEDGEYEILDSDQEHDVSDNEPISGQSPQESGEYEDQSPQNEDDMYQFDDQEGEEDQSSPRFADDMIEEPQGIESENPIEVPELDKDDIESNPLLQDDQEDHPEGENPEQEQQWGGSEEDQPVKDPEVEGENYQPEGEDESAGEDIAQQNGDQEQLKQQVAQALEAFKAKKDVIDQLKQADPELHGAILGMLENMIALTQVLNSQMGKSEQLKKKV